MSGDHTAAVAGLRALVATEMQRTAHIHLMGRESEIADKVLAWITASYPTDSVAAVIGGLMVAAIDVMRAAAPTDAILTGLLGASVLRLNSVTTREEWDALRSILRAFQAPPTG